MSGSWYYQLMGEEFGPLSTEELRQRAADGTITAETYVRRGDNDRWIAATRVNGLFDHRRSNESRPIAVDVCKSLTEPDATADKRSPVVVASATTKSLISVRWVAVGGALLMLATVAGIAAFFLASGLDPTVTFKDHVKKVSAGLTPALQASELGKVINTDGELTFNVEKTNSTVSPFSAWLKFKSISKPDGLTVLVVNEYEWTVNYTFNEQAWVRRDISIVISNTVTKNEYASALRPMLGERIRIDESRSENAQLMSLLEVKP